MRFRFRKKNRHLYRNRPRFSVNRFQFSNKNWRLYFFFYGQWRVMCIDPLDFFLTTSFNNHFLPRIIGFSDFYREFIINQVSNKERLLRCFCFINMRKHLLQSTSLQIVRSFYSWWTIVSTFSRLSRTSSRYSKIPPPLNTGLSPSPFFGQYTTLDRKYVRLQKRC